MLGFRSLFRTHDTPELLDVAAQKLFIWLPPTESTAVDSYTPLGRPDRGALCLPQFVPLSPTRRAPSGLVGSAHRASTPG